MSFITSSWVKTNAGVSANGKIVSASADFVTAGGANGYLLTGSNQLILHGSPTFVEGNIAVNSGANDTGYYYGPGLGIIHSLNCCTSESIAALLGETGGGPADTPVSMGIPLQLSESFATNEGLNQKDAFYWLQDYSSSGAGADSLSGFKESEGPIPFIIKKGDEIVCTYNEVLPADQATTIPTYKTQTFIVTEISGSLDGPRYGHYSASFCAGDTCYLGQQMFNQNNSLRNLVKVFPNPEVSGLIAGTIGNFVIRRRVNADDRVLVYQQTPNSTGIGEVTGSGGGYLIPNDFTPQQKRNALTLINQLKQKNAFRDDSQIIDPTKNFPLP